MSSYKILLLSGAAALVSSAALAAEFDDKDIPLHASAVPGFDRVAPIGDPKTARCGAVFGAELPTPDGIISWNDTSGLGYDVGGAADFTCSVKTKIKQVWVTGRNPWGTNPDQYNVTFYKSDSAGGSDEPDDGQVVCAYTGLMGAGGLGFEAPVLTKLKLGKPCKLKPGKYWVEVQNNDSVGAWYWDYSSTLQGTRTDWADRNNKFGDGCTTFDDNEYLSDCLGYTYPDYMLELH